MAAFTSGSILTKRGEALQAKIEAKKATLDVTRIQVGDGEAVSIHDYYERNSLIEPKISVPITSVETEANHCVLHTNISSIGVDESFYARELGLFVNDSDGNEILFAVSHDENPSYIYNKETAVAITNEFDIVVAVGSADKVNLTLPIDAQEFVTLAGSKAIAAADSAASAANSATSAENAASRAASEAGNAAVAKSGADDALTSAKEQVRLATQQKDEATKQAQNASTSATSASQSLSSARDVQNKVQEIYDSLHFNIIGPKAKFFNDADFIVGASAAQMKEGE